MEGHGGGKVRMVIMGHGRILPMTDTFMRGGKQEIRKPLRLDSKH
jgi:hypothetical protein